MYISERLWYSNKGRLCSESKCPSRELPRLPVPARLRTPSAEQPHPLENTIHPAEHNNARKDEQEDRKEDLEKDINKWGRS